MGMARWLLVLALAATPALAAPWPSTMTNPKPLPGDLTLPLPCEGAIVLRPVAVPASAGALGDRAVVLGQGDTQTPYSDFTQRSFLAGAFGDSARGATQYFLGKYEITRDQYAAVMGSPCPTPTDAGSAPMTNVSWFDAVAFSAKLSTWWLTNARAQLPARDGVPGFARLPTEEEWEFAARGGVAVSDGDFRDKLPDGDPLSYAWLQGPRSAAGRVRPIGRLAANTLGLHDMIGNAAEWVLEPFRLNKVGRPHGQVGGVVARGPHWQTDISQARTSLRVEYAPFSPTTGAPLALPTIGFRIALGAPAGTTEARLNEVGQAFARESGALSAQADDPISLVGRLRETAPDEATRRALLELEARLRIDSRGGQDVARAVLRERILALVATARAVRSELNTNNLVGDIQDYLRTSEAYLQDAVRPTNRQLIQVMEAQRNVFRTRVQTEVRSYRVGLERMIRTANGLDVATQAEALAQEFTAQQQPLAAALTRQVAEHIQATLAGRLPSASEIEIALGRVR
jgi:formylglycine-generating enzyme required for sulfatase activity